MRKNYEKANAHLEGAVPLSCKINRLGKAKKNYCFASHAKNHDAGRVLFRNKWRMRGIFFISQKAKYTIFRNKKKRSIERSIEKGDQMGYHAVIQESGAMQEITQLLQLLIYILQTFEKTHQTVLRFFFYTFLSRDDDNPRSVN